MTNEDHVRQMPVEELAKLFIFTSPPKAPCLRCDQDIFDRKNCKCDKCWLAWLKKEADEPFDPVGWFMENLACD